MYVYKITNTVNDKIYIGITKCIKTRWAQHKCTAFNPNHSEYNKVLYRAFRKYGIDTFKFEVLKENIDIEAAKTAEVLLIEDLNCLSKANGYNVTPGGDLVEDTRALRGEASPLSKITDGEAKDIITRRDNGELQNKVFADYSDKLKFTGFQSIWAGNSWKHLQPSVIAKRHGRRFLTDAQVREIRIKASSKELTQLALSKLYNVPTSTISNIVNFKTYTNVT